jgi:hypothetical protein
MPSILKVAARQSKNRIAVATAAAMTAAPKQTLHSGYRKIIFLLQAQRRPKNKLEGRSGTAHLISHVGAPRIPEI